MFASLMQNGKDEEEDKALEHNFKVLINFGKHEILNKYLLAKMKKTKRNSARLCYKLYKVSVD